MLNKPTLVKFKKPILIKSANSDSYKISLMKDQMGNYSIWIKSLHGAGHTAKHTAYNLVDSRDEIIKICNISLEISDSLIENILKKGDTEGFNLTEKEFNTKDSEVVNEENISPNSIRHELSHSEKSFTSRGDKLNYHWPIFKKYKETGYGSIIRATLTLHQVCSSHCHYCSTIARNKRDSISLEEAKSFVKALYFDQADFNKKNFSNYNDLYKEQTGADIRLRGLILSGGGQPNLWPHFSEFVEWLSTLDIELGLITNGFPVRLDEKIYSNFTWIRLSITPEDASPHYKNQKFNNQPIPQTIINNNNITFGLSYVYGAWTDNDILQRINNTIKEWNVDYCRMLTDCNLTRNSQLQAHKHLSERLYELSYINKDGNPTGKIFHQLKYHGTEKEGDELWEDGQCYLQLYNVFWDTTGHQDNGVSYCYTCDSITVLAEENDSEIDVSERRFNSDKWGTVSNDKVNILFENKVSSYFDPREQCTSCLFMRNNQAVKDLISLEDYASLELDDQIIHVNFP